MTEAIKKAALHGHVVGAAVLSGFSVLFLFVLHPQLGIRDVDGHAYIMGARSLRNGTGYRSLMGESFDQWPPGYSLLLSAFSDPIRAAQVVNYLSFGVVIGLLYDLLRRCGWSWQAGLGCTVVLGSGFFRLLANQVHADILTYALFLVAVWLVANTHGRVRPAGIWAALIPVKLIAVTFVPSAFVADIVARQEWKTLCRRYLPAAVFVLIGLGSVVAFDAWTVGTWIPGGHVPTTPELLLRGATRAIVGIPRILLFSWHGSVAAPVLIGAFVVCLLLAILCLVALRPAPGPEGLWHRVYGLTFLVCAALILCVRFYDPVPRHLGYGLIVLMLGFRPKKWANGLWLAYGLASLVVGVANGRTVPWVGLNDPRYAVLGAEVRTLDIGPEPVATNSFRLLELHAGIPSVRIANEVEAVGFHKLLWVTLPNSGPTTAVTPMPRPGAEWCEDTVLTGGALFTRCPTPPAP